MARENGTGRQRLDAVRELRAQVIGYCLDLSEDQWLTPSAAAGWRVVDVIGHLAGVARTLVTPAAVRAMFGNDSEAANDELVAAHSGRTPAQTLAAYVQWSGRLLRVFGVATRPPFGAVPLRVAELGWYPMRLTPSMVAFDTAVHLREDIAPVLDRPAPPPLTGTQQGVVLEWMLAGLEQMNRAELSWLAAPIVLTLDGPGGGSWRVSPGRAGRHRVRPAEAYPGLRTVAHVRGRADEFVRWATTRTPWRDAALDIEGDRALAARFLDSVNIV